MISVAYSVSGRTGRFPVNLIPTAPGLGGRSGHPLIRVTKRPARDLRPIISHGTTASAYGIYERSDRLSVMCGRVSGEDEHAILATARYLINSFQKSAPRDCGLWEISR